MSDWDRFAAEEYELLVAEEGNAEGMDDLWVIQIFLRLSKIMNFDIF